MRKPAPAVILTTLIAFASGSALALGDRAKEKKAPESQTMTQPAQSSTVPGSAPSPLAPSKATTDGSAASAPAVQPGTSATTRSSVDSSMAASTNGATSKPKGNKDGKCDEAKYPNKSGMPPECSEKTSGGAGSAGASSSGSGAASAGDGASSSGASSSSSK